MDNGVEVFPAVNAKEPWNILEKAPDRFDFFRDPDDFPEEAGALSAEPCPLSSD